jgi:integrase
METDDLPIDLFAQPYARVVPLKGARESAEGRIVVFAPSTSRAIFAYLRVRSAHPYAESPFLWLGKRGRLTSSGIDQMLERRADRAGYDPKLIHAHMFRHTFVNDWLAGNGSEGDLMRLMGWKDRSTLDRYAEDQQVQRAIEARRRKSDMY